jgi:hypothetical protein
MVEGTSLSTFTVPWIVFTFVPNDVPNELPTFPDTTQGV